MTGELLIRNVAVGRQQGQDVLIRGGRIEAIAPRLRRGDADLDGEGGTLLPGLIDHHIHLLGLAARLDSVVLDDAYSPEEIARRINDACAARPPGSWVRATGYHERSAGPLDAAALDALAPRHRLRLQHQSGVLWMLNTPALSAVLGTDNPPPCVELRPDGRASGRVWRGDAWLGARIGRSPPPLGPVGAMLSAFGITGVTDAGAGNDASSLALVARAAASDALPQRVVMMSAGALAPPPDGAVAIGPVKLLLDEATLPEFDDVIARIEAARHWRRSVAVHCVTAAELAFTLAAFAAAGARPGDRIEHGGVIPPEAIAQIAELGLTVVTQPALPHERGDRYLRDAEPEDCASLWRCASLLRAGVPVAGSSDAPYASPDPWAAIRAAAERRTSAGQPIAPAEQISTARALDLYLGSFARPGGPGRRIAVGAAADLCLLDRPLAAMLAAPDAAAIAATIVAGRIVWRRGAGPAAKHHQEQAA